MYTIRGLEDYYTYREDPSREENYDMDTKYDEMRDEAFLEEQARASEEAEHDEN